MTSAKSVPDAPADPSPAYGARAITRRKPSMSDRATPVRTQTHRVARHKRTSRQAEGRPMAQGRLIISTKPRHSMPAPPAFARIRRRPLDQRVVLVVIGLALVLLALGGWAAQALRLAR